MLERRGSHAEMDPGPRHDLSPLSSERFRRTSMAAGRSKAVRRSVAGLDHQDRIHECITERRLLCSIWQRWCRPRRSIAKATDNGKTVLGVLSSDSVCAGATQGSLAHTSGPEAKQSDIATRDRLARRLTGVSPASEAWVQVILARREMMLGSRVRQPRGEHQQTQSPGFTWSMTRAQPRAALQRLPIDTLLSWTGVAADRPINDGAGCPKHPKIAPTAIG